MSDRARTGPPDMAAKLVRAAWCGTAAGVVGTLAMDTLLYRRYRKSGGKPGFRRWEFSGAVQSWQGAPAPALFGKRLVERLTRKELPDRHAARLNNVTHWGFGGFAGAQYGVLTAMTGPPPHVLLGLPFGAVVWGVGYVVLPLMKLYEPIWRYDRETLQRDLSAHLVYGMVTALAYRRGTRLAGDVSRARATRATRSR